MHTEIERKFLVTDETWREKAPGIAFRQGYIDSNQGCIIRVRTEGKQAFLTIKGPKAGISRPEFEYEIPFADAEILLQTLAQKPLIEKKRYKIPLRDHLWEVDEFLGENEGLIVAEVELANEEESFVHPDWLGKEVTEDARYRNASLARRPYCTWSQEEREAARHK